MGIDGGPKEGGKKKRLGKRDIVKALRSLRTHEEPPEDLVERTLAAIQRRVETELVGNLGRKAAKKLSITKLEALLRARHAGVEAAPDFTERVLERLGFGTKKAVERATTRARKNRPKK